MTKLLIMLVATTILSLHRPNETITCAFTETMTMPKMNKTTVREGTLVYHGPDELRMNYTKPAGDYTLIAKDKFEVRRAGKVQRFNVSNPKQRMSVYRATLLACLGGDVKRVAELNQAKVDYKTVGGRYVCTLKTDKASPHEIVGLQLEYDCKSGKLLMMKITEGNGNYTTYVVK